MKVEHAFPKTLPVVRGDRGVAACHALFFLAVGVFALVAGCAPARQRLVGEEARAAAVFFTSAPDVSFPLRASFSGIAEISGRSVPFLAGLLSRTESEEILGVYDPFGHAVLFLHNEGGSMSVTRGPAAKEFPPEDVRPLDAGPVSLGRILSGAPGYPATGGEASITGSGAWVLAGRGQTLFSDPSRRILSRAEYDISGKRVTVTYPGRESPGPPRTVEVEVMGNKVVFRRDAE
ncbi:MAG: hypothetical protein HKM29_03295 [Deltaproteobacteria bacterium]|nr:hypothetical protein [Deltaproteobacteria bacterium]